MILIFLSSHIFISTCHMAIGCGIHITRGQIGFPFGTTTQLQSCFNAIVCYHAIQFDQGATDQRELLAMYTHGLRAKIAHAGGIQSMRTNHQTCFCHVHVCFPKGGCIPGWS